MDAVAFPPPPAPFLDEDYDFGDFTFASATAPAAPQPPLADPRPATFAAFDDDWGDFVASPLGSDAEAPPTAASAAAPSSWEKPRGPLPLSLFGAGDDQEEGGREEEGPAGLLPTATAPQRVGPFTTDGSRPADLKDLIAGLYGSQPPPAAGTADVVLQEEAEDGQGLGDDDWEFTAATADPAGQDRGGRAPGDGSAKIESSSFETDENHSSRSTSDCILIEFYHRLREESLAVIFRHVKDLKEAQKIFTHSDENSRATAIEREIQEIYDKLNEPSLPKGFCTEEHPRDVSIRELLKCIKEEQLKDFEQEYCLAEKISQATEDTSVAVELYKHCVSTLCTLELASKGEQGDYVDAWYSMLLPCAEELQHGAAIWQESCHANVCDQVISEDPGMLSKMMACLDRCSNAWTSSLQMSLKMVVDSNFLHASVAKALMESINKITELEVPSLQNSLPTNETACRLSLLPPGIAPGMKLVMWNGGQYIVKVANLWANLVASYPPQLPHTPILKE
ncbi:unnamed protein product [Urochloa decumbens]|uniref:Synergin gamma C-terminal domain-containing protein n=1 Tax=Urochloa decumbens TaxID=240449 RepID=A0ABC9HC81_9POAL